MQPPPQGQVTRLLDAVGQGDRQAAARLLEMVYEELRTVARGKLGDRAQATLQPTALVHEAYLRLLGDRPARWTNRRHFFAAAARSMRDIVVEAARRRATLKRGGQHQRQLLDEACLRLDDDPDGLLALDEALARLEGAAPVSAQVVTLRFYAGLTMPEVAAALEMSLASAERHWTFAKAWLHRALDRQDG